MTRLGKILFTLLICFGLQFSCRQNTDIQIDIRKIEHVKNFIKNKNYNQRIAVFINFRLPANRYRFFIYDFKKKKIIEKGLVSHGAGSETKDTHVLKFSNVENSYQSSLGKYEILGSYTGKFGKSYRLKGLDSTNSNAIKRAIVLHSYPCVPDTEGYQNACLSLGCPMLSKSFFNTVAKYIDQSDQNIILYAYY